MARGYSMEFNVTGEERKELVAAIAEYTGCEKRFLGVPGLAYEVGDYLIEKNGTVSTDEPDTEEIRNLLEHLEGKGFSCAQESLNEEEKAEVDEIPAGEEKALTGGEEATGGVDLLMIELPRTSLSDEAIKNIENIVKSKGELMKHAFGVDELPVKVDETKVSFPWFRDAGPDEARAYTTFIKAIISMANDQKRVSTKPVEAESEKYAFRCFLLRLGLIGKEFKKDREVLLRNLPGCAAFPNEEAAEKFAAKQKALRLAAKEARR